MQLPVQDESHRYRALTRANIQKIPEWKHLGADIREAIEVVSTVLPFKTNEYITRELIDWDRVPDDPIFQLTFVQPGMLEASDYTRMAGLIRSGASKAEIEASANAIRLRLNPHPAGQMSHNVPVVGGRKIEGVQHKYRETVLFFPRQGQTCHAYCTFCFRWAQFVGLDGMKFEARESDDLTSYLRQQPEITDVLITGGDPMVMKARIFRRYIEPLLQPEFSHINIRIGTKSVAYWPQRYVSDDDADEMCRLFEDITASGRHLALMGHYNHPRELQTDVAERAIARIRATGAQIRMQSPLIRRINDDAATWAELWRTGVRLGCIPYYMFVERDTGPQHYFEVPLGRAWKIFADAYRQVSGLARTVRGPSMSTHAGKVAIDGVARVGDREVFALQFLQARDPALVRRPFFANFDEKATWFTDLSPAFASDEVYFERPSTDPRRLTIL